LIEAAHEVVSPDVSDQVRSEDEMGGALMSHPPMSWQVPLVDDS
jgi:hypothetical protein